MSGKSRIETTNADDKSIGFDYQYYYFLNELLNLKTGQAVGLEFLDDVHVRRADGINLLIQLKHTVQKNAEGYAINLTTMDHDLWKSISNWCKVIADPEDGRNDIAAQLAYLKNTRFLLASNKSRSDNNSFLASFTKFTNGKETYAELIENVENLKNRTQDKVLQAYMAELLSLDKEVCRTFFQQLDFALGIDEVIQICKRSIIEKQIHPTRVDDVFNAVDSEVRQHSFATVKAGGKIEIAYEEFNQRYRRHFDRGRSGELIWRDFEPLLSDNLLNQTFIKQLVDIDDIAEDAIEYHSTFTARRINFRNNLEKLRQDGEIVQSDIDAMEDEARLMWENQFLHAHSGRSPLPDERVPARNILVRLRAERLKLASQEVPLSFSNGGFYDLSNRPIIGWLKNWKDRYG